MSRSDLWVPHLAGARGGVLGELRGKQADAAGAVVVLPDGARLVVGHADGTVRCVALETGETRWLATQPHQPVLQALACSPDGRLVASSAEDKLVRLWDTATGAVVRQDVHRHTVLDLQFAPSGELLATAGADDTIGVWRVDTGQHVVSCEGHEAWVVSVAWSPREDLLASVSNDGTLRIWDAASGAERQRRDLATKPHAVAWSPSGERLAVGLGDGQVSVLDPSGATSPPAELLQLRADDDAVNGLAWSADGRALATSGDRAVQICDARTGRAHQRFAFDEPYAWRLSWAPSGAFVAVSLCGDVVRLWDTRGALAEIAGAP